METNEKLTTASRIPCGNCGSEMTYSAEKKHCFAVIVGISR